MLGVKGASALGSAAISGRLGVYVALLGLREFCGTGRGEVIGRRHGLFEELQFERWRCMA